MIRIFVDGQEGTTGLQIHERLSRRSDVEILQISPDKRKDPAERERLLNASDVAFLCLPDEAARESAALVRNPSTIVIDASTAHRTDSGWVYGLPELSPETRSAIARAKRIANPGCYATGFLLAVAPLVLNKWLPAQTQVVCHAVSGYSGGGKKLIAAYETPEALCRDTGSSPRLFAPRHYALALRHKHLPEMQKHSGLTHAPLFSPAVGPYYQGMAVHVSLFSSQLINRAPASAVAQLLSEFYRDQHFVQVESYAENPALDGGFLDPTQCNHTNRAKIHVFGHDSQIQICAVLDNLGKGASGAAIQNMNIALGLPENLGLE